MAVESRASPAQADDQVPRYRVAAAEALLGVEGAAIGVVPAATVAASAPIPAPTPVAPGGFTVASR